MTVVIVIKGVSVSDIFCDKIFLIAELSFESGYIHVYQQLNVLILDSKYR